LTVNQDRIIEWLRKRVRTQVWLNLLGGGLSLLNSKTKQGHILTINN
jgi:hypothetical protein